MTLIQNREELAKIYMIYGYVWVGAQNQNETLNTLKIMIQARLIERFYQLGMLIQKITAARLAYANYLSVKAFDDKCEGIK